MVKCFSKLPLPVLNGTHPSTWICQYHPGIEKCFSLALFLFICLSNVSAQDRAALEAQRKRLLQDIQQTSQQLSKTEKTKTTELSRFELLKSQVDQREQLLNTLKSEIRSIELQIKVSQQEIKVLKDEIAELTTEYGEILRKSYKIKLGTDPMLLLLSSENLNQAFQRWLYVNQIKKMRGEQLALIRSNQLKLEEKVSQLLNYQSEQQVLLNEEEQQKMVLIEELNQKESLLERLREDENTLRAQLNKQKEKQRQLQDAIQKIIAEEIARQKREAEERARAEAKRNSADTKEPPIADPKAERKIRPDLPSTPQMIALSKSFDQNRGKLPWPVDKGVISKRFGTQAHSVLNNVSISNNGIDIRTDVNAPVKAVFDGVVVGKKFIPGQHYLVLIRHGKFYTIYANLINVNVREGQNIMTGDILGYSPDDGDSFSEIHFELWQETIKQNPSEWLRK